MTAKRRRTLPVVLAEPDAKRRVRLSRALGSFPGIKLVGQAGDPASAVTLAAETQTGVVLIGPNLSRSEALRVIRQVANQAPKVRTVVLAEDANDRSQQVLLFAGASGVVSADVGPKRLSGTLEDVARGEAAVSPALKAYLLERYRRASASRHGMRPLLGPLSTREWQVLDELRAGASTEKAAAKLGITRATVYSHLRNISRKLGTASRDEAIAFADRLRERATTGAGLEG